ncbi:substrate-binding periplasmic protein [Piscinibacter terrae]|nr:transporter substrate-binding domain-containing protein [Albitalea terrae]
MAFDGLLKRTCSVLAGTLMALAPWPAASQADTRPVVKACGHHDYPPWNWEHDGQIVGACASIATRAIERLGYRVDLRYLGPWKRCQVLVETGQADVNICAFSNSERLARTVIVEPRMGQNLIAVFYRQGARDPSWFHQWDDLRGLRTGLIIGVSMGPEFDDFLSRHTTVERVANLDSVMKMLSLGRVDIAPFGLEAGRIALDSLGLNERVVPAIRPALVGDLYLFIAKNSPLAARVDEIGAYFLRRDYADELAHELAFYRKAYVTDHPVRQ